jgi:acetyl-CoA C-acetyltransferase
MLIGAADDDPPVIVGGSRTAIAKFGGSLRAVEAHQFGALCVTAALERAGVEPWEVDEVVMGQVGEVGPDAYNARRVALAAGLPPTTTAMNVNRLCGSGLQAIVSAAKALLVGEARVIVAGGDESMSRQPFLDYTPRDSGWRLGGRHLVDGTLSLVTDPFGGYPMGTTAETVAERYEVTREAQDAFALVSQERAAAAIEQGWFKREIVPVELPTGETFSEDEHPRATTVEQLAQLRPAFREAGTVTAGNSSGISDGAAAVVMMRESGAKQRGLEPALRLRSWAVSGIHPEVMGYAPAAAIPAAIEAAGLTLDDIDVVELNEAFAAQAIAVMRDVGLDPAKVNIAGGAIALGHPVGATGAILTVKLLYALTGTEAQYGLVSLCIGGGQGIAAVFERPTT